MGDGSSERWTQELGVAGPKFPACKQEADLMEEDFMNEFSKLSLHEHEKILFDIHGLGHVDDDPPDVDGKLDELQRELDLIEVKEAFDSARRMNAAYVDGRGFRLMFLRAVKFDSKLAAGMLVIHFEVKRCLFGDSEILGRDIRMSDLSQDAMKVLESGCMQILPSRDVAGRAVDCTSTFFIEGMSAEAMSCSAWYYYMVVLKDEELQKNGFVSIFYNYGHYSRGPDFFEKVRSYLVNSIPAKLCAAHYCTCDEALEPFVAGIRSFMDGDERFLLKTHIGDPQEVEFELQTYGVPTNDCPMQHDGSWSTAVFLEWLERQRTKEQEGEGGVKASSNIVVPRRYDVLFGRSKKAREHTGNLRIIHACSERLAEYEAASKPEKTKISDSLLDLVRQAHGRFLKWEDGGWVEADDGNAREKISHFFRHMRSKGVQPETKVDAKTRRKRTTSDPPALIQAKVPCPPSVVSDDAWDAEVDY